MLRYQRTQRLTHKTQFSGVFEQADFRYGNNFLLVLAKWRSDDESGRLGLVASKKHLKTSVGRNRFKRMSRESFRQHQRLLIGCDVVIMSRNKSLECTSLMGELLQVWPKLERKRARMRASITTPGEGEEHRR